MTLILTALCKNGIYVCADRRRQIKRTNSLVENQDNFNKIYKFKNIPLIIYNHGLNQFNGKFWNVYCSDFERSKGYKGKNLKKIVNDFKNLIESDVLLQLERNKQEMSNLMDVHAAGFVLCGKTAYDSKYSVYELFWSPDLTLCHHKGIITGSGVGYKYSKNYVEQNIDLIASGFLKPNSTEAKNELIKLFNIAIKEKKRLGGEEFSDEFDIDSV